MRLLLQIATDGGDELWQSEKVGMKYNFDYAISSMVFLIILFCYLKLRFAQTDEKSRAFIRIVIGVFFANLLDIISAWEIMGKASPLVNYTFSIACYISVAVVTYLYIRYICALVAVKKIGWITYMNITLLVVYSLLILTTPFTKLVFYFTADGNYEYGVFSFAGYLIYVYYFVLGIILLIKYRKEFFKEHIWGILAFIVVSLAGPALGVMIYKGVLLNFFSITVSMYILLFAIETPDFKAMKETMEELKKAQTAAKESAQKAELARDEAEKSRAEAEKARQEAQSANKAKSDFLANMSHEIRTPINGILGMNNIALAENKDAAIHEMLISIGQAGETLLSIVSNILDVARFETGDLELEENEYELIELLQSMNSFYGDQAREKGLEFQIVNDSGIPSKLYGDSKRVRQVLTNLLSNAVKYTRKGRISLEINYMKAGVDSVVLDIFVRDTGVGIKNDDILKLFSNFSRVDMEHNRTVSGAGLGLRIVKELAELMGGSVNVESEYGLGTTFEVKLVQKVLDGTPMGSFVPVADRVRADVSDLAKPQMSGVSILAVDDIELNLKVLAGLLKGTGISLDTAISGAKCLELTTQKKYDMILMDHMMPGMDGIETMRRLKQQDNAKNSDTLVVVLTANAISGAKEIYINAGFNDYISKPLLPQSFYALLRKYLPENEGVQDVDSVGILGMSQEVMDISTNGVPQHSGGIFAPVSNVEPGEPYALSHEQLMSGGLDFSVYDEEETAETPENLTETEEDITAEEEQQEHNNMTVAALDFLDVKEGMMYCSNDEGIYLAVVESYAVDSRIDSTQQFFDEKDWDNYRICVHAIKSSSKLIGDMPLSEAAKELEFAVKEDRIDYILENHAAFMEKYVELVNKIKGLL